MRIHPFAITSALAAAAFLAPTIPLEITNPCAGAWQIRHHYADSTTPLLAELTYPDFPVPPETLALGQQWPTYPYGEMVFLARQPGPIRLIVRGDTLLAEPSSSQVCAFPFPVEPPGSVPEWIHSDTNTATLAETPFRYASGVLVLQFLPGVPLANRGAILQSINGRVIGGRTVHVYDEGMYYVAVPQKEFNQLHQIADSLRALPGVIAFVDLASAVE